MSLHERSRGQRATPASHGHGHEEKDPLRAAEQDALRCKQCKKKKINNKNPSHIFFWGGEEGASQPRGVRGAAAAAGPLLPLRCLPVCVCVCLCVCVCVCVCACGAVHPNLGVPEGARVMV